MATRLPTSPSPQTSRPRLLRFGGDLTPTLGGPVQRIVRLGSRHQLDVTLPPLTDAQRRAWLAAMEGADTRAETVILAFPDAGGVALGAGAAVAGGGQAGSSLNVSGVTAGLAIPAGSFFTIVTAGRRYLHMTTADAVATGGAATLAIAPMLRASPAVGSPIISGPPEIEGFVEGSTLEWGLALDRTTAISFTVTEAE